MFAEVMREGAYLFCLETAFNLETADINCEIV